MGDALSARLRSNKQALSDGFELAAREELPLLGQFDSNTLCDHLPELFEALAHWVDGDIEAARPGFEALAEGHAMQRLGFGIDLETLTSEYAVLRRVLLRDCLGPVFRESTPESVARLNGGLDEAILGSIRRYASSRDRVRDRFIGILAHDLRNPLNTISVAAGRLLVTAEGIHSRENKIAAMI